MNSSEEKLQFNLHYNDKSQAAVHVKSFTSGAIKTR